MVRRLGPFILGAVLMGCGQEAPQVPKSVAIVEFPDRPYEKPVHDPALNRQLATLDSIKGELDAQHLETSQALKSIIIRHSASVPGLLWVLHRSVSRNSRIGAVIALKEMGWTNVLHTFAQDKDERVRNLVQAVTFGPQVFIHGCISGRTFPPPYRLDPSLKEWALRLAKLRIELTESESKVRVANVLPDFFRRNDPKKRVLGGHDAPSDVAYRLASRDPVKFLTSALEIDAASESSGNLVGAISSLTYRTFRTPEMYEVTREYLRKAFRHEDTRVKRESLRAAANIFPVEKLEEVLEAAVAAEDEKTLSQVMDALCSLVLELGSLGLPESANHLIAMVERHGGPGEVERVKNTLATHQPRPSRRRLRVEELIEVSEDEYEDALIRFGTLWLSPDQFKLVRPSYVPVADRPPFPYGM